MPTLADLAAFLPYGCSVWYAARVQGVTTLLLEAVGDAVAPAGYTLDGALVMDDAPRLGATIDPRKHLGAAFDFTFSFADTATVRALFSRPAHVSTLTQDISASDTTLHLADASGWPSTGVAHVAGEAIPYTGTTSDTLTGGTRGSYGAAKARPAGSVVTSGPRYWVGRRVDLFAVLLDPTGRYVQGDDVLSEAAHVWSGYVVARPTRGTVTWDLQARSIDRRLAETLGSAASGKAWWDLDDDIVAEFDPNAVLTVRIEEVASTDGAWHTIETCVLQPWAALTSPARTSSLRRAVIEAWEAYAHATGVGHAQWTAVIPSDSASGQQREHRLSIQYDAQYGAGLGVVVFSLTLDGAAPFAIPRHHTEWTLVTVGGWYEAGLRQRASLRAASLSVDLEDTAPDELPTAGWVRLGDKDTSELYRFTSRTTDDVVSNRVHLQLDPSTQPDLTALGLLDASEEGRKELDVVILWRSTGTYAEVMVEMLTSATIGYGLAGDVDEASFEAALDGAFATLAAEIAVDGEVSFERLFGDLLRVSNRGVVVVETSAGPRLTCVQLGPPDGPPVATIRTADLAWAPTSSTAPVRKATTQTQVPGRLELSPIPGTRAPGAPDPAPVIVRNVEAPEFGGDSWQLKIFGVDSAALAGPAFAWGRAYFVAAETWQVVEIDVAPWVTAQPGHIVRLELEDPSLWDYATGTPGYTGLGRVLGAPAHPLALIRTLTVAIGGAAASGALSPSAEILAYTGPSNDPTALKLDRSYYPVMASYLEGETSFDLQIYVAGYDAAGVVGYNVEAVTDDGTHCVLAGTMTGINVDLAGGDTFRVTLPLLEDGSAEQAAYLHSGQQVQWS